MNHVPGLSVMNLPPLFVRRILLCGFQNRAGVMRANVFTMKVNSPAAAGVKTVFAKMNLHVQEYPVTISLQATALMTARSGFFQMRADAGRAPAFMKAVM
jgi:hypothetical protein